MSPRAHRLDQTDLRLLALLQADARATHAELGRRVHLAPSAVFARVRALETSGVIRDYETRLDPAVLGAGLTAFVFVSTTERPGGVHTGQRLAAIPEVQEVHHVVGEDCLLVKLRVADNAALARLLHDRFGPITTIRGTRTTIVLETLKETGRFQLTQSVPATAAPAKRPARRRTKTS